MFKLKHYRVCFPLLVSLLCVALVAAACGGDDYAAEPEAQDVDAPAPPPDTEVDEPDGAQSGPAFGDGSLGVVAVEIGDAIQI